MQRTSEHLHTSMQPGFGMKTFAVKSFVRGFVLLFVLSLTASGAWAQKINVNQDTFVLSNEANGYFITMLINAGYGNLNLYQTLVTIKNNATPSVAGILTPAFMSTLQNCPPGSEIFTTLLKDTVAHGISVSISTDGTARYDDIEGRPFMGSYPTLQSNISGVGNASFTHSTDSQLPLNATVVDGPLAGMTTTYKAFSVAWVPVAAPAANAVPALSEWGLVVFALLTVASAAYVLRRS